MVVARFRSRARANVDAKEYGRLGQRLRETASALPGFVSLDVFENADGETLIVAKFENAEAEARWRDHPDHVAARERRAEFYIDYDVQVCEVIRDYRWTRPIGN